MKEKIKQNLARSRRKFMERESKKLISSEDMAKASMKGLLFLINQFADLNAKLRAINTYYKIRGFYRNKKKK